MKYNSVTPAYTYTLHRFDRVATQKDKKPTKDGTSTNKIEDIYQI